MANYPIFEGTHQSSTIDGAPISPFAGVTIDDPSSAQNPTETVLIQVSRYGNAPGGGGTLGDGAGFTGTSTLERTGANTYQITGTIGAVTTELDALSFTPNPGQPGGAVYSDLMLIVTNSFGRSNDYYPDGATLISNATDPDTLSFAPQVSFNDGVFTLTGQASSVVGVSGVEITATLGNGTVKDLGAATVSGDGTFTFRDRIGRQTQGYITATETDGTGYGTSASASYSLQGGPDQDGAAAEQDVYTSDGSADAYVSYFQPDGVHTTDVLTSGQTLSADYTDTFDNDHQGNTTFVYDPGHGSNIVTELRLRGAQHDTLSFSGADFDDSVADLLAHSYGPGDGSGVIVVDPVTRDTVQLAGITKRGLVANQGDIAFHA